MSDAVIAPPRKIPITRVTSESGPVRAVLIAIALLFLTLVVFLPLAAVFTEAFRRGLGAYLEALGDPDTMHAIGLSFRVAILAVAVNIVVGGAAAWAVAKFEFRGKNLLLTLIDLPIALPTAVAGIALAVIYAPNGLVGALLAPFGIKVAYTPLAVIVALIFVGLPFVVRTIQPVLAESEKEIEEAAALLGASRLRTVFSVVLPLVSPALLTGFALAFARGVGEYGSVIFVAGNLPFVSEIAPLLIVIRLEEFDYGGAAVIATVMLALSFFLLMVISALQTRNRRRLGYV